MINQYPKRIGDEGNIKGWISLYHPGVLILSSGDLQAVHLPREVHKALLFELAMLHGYVLLKDDGEGGAPREDLFCPQCQQPHIDVNEWAIRLHKTHECQHCGCRFEGSIKAVSFPTFKPE